MGRSSAFKAAPTKRIKQKSGKKRSNGNRFSSQDEALFQKQLSKMNYTVKEVTGDGNCLFRSMSDQLFGNEDNCGPLRIQVVDYLKSNKEEFYLFLEDDECWDDYLIRMAGSGEWGGHIELHALSRIIPCIIVVHQLDQPIWVISPPISSTTSSSKKRMLKELHLSYHEGMHYNSLRLLNDMGKDGGANHPYILQVDDGAGRSLNCNESLVRQATGVTDSDVLAFALSFNSGDIDLTIDWICDIGKERVMALYNGQKSDSQSLSKSASTYTKVPTTSLQEQRMNNKHRKKGKAVSSKTSKMNKTEGTNKKKEDACDEEASIVAAFTKLHV